MEKKVVTASKGKDIGKGIGKNKYIPTHGKSYSVLIPSTN